MPKRITTSIEDKIVFFDSKKGNETACLIDFHTSIAFARFKPATLYSIDYSLSSQ